MCGIAGIFRIDGRAGSEDAAAVKRMIDAEAHRGPDGEGLFWDKRALLGHRRFSCQT